MHLLQVHNFLIGSQIRLKRGESPAPAANAVNVSQACKYKSVKTGLLKQFVVTSIVKFSMLMFVFTFKYRVYC